MFGVLTGHDIWFHIGLIIPKIPRPGLYMLLLHWVNIEHTKNGSVLASVFSAQGFCEPEQCQEKTSPCHTRAARSLHHKRLALCL